MTDVVTVERIGRSRGSALAPSYVRGRFRMAGRGSLAALMPHVEAGPIRDAAVAVRPDGIVVCQGGPIAGPEDAQTPSTTRAAWPGTSAGRPWNGCRRRWRSLGT